jgi:hypothetical protein
VVHHAGWDSTRSRGASAIVDWAANIWMLEEVRKEKEHKTFLKVKHQKSRNYDKQEPFFLDKTCYPEMLWVDRKDVNLAEDALKWQVLTRLDSGMSQGEAANLLGTTKGNVSKIRALAIQKGWFTEQNKLTQTGFKYAGYNTN